MTDRDDAYEMVVSADEKVVIQMALSHADLDPESPFDGQRLTLTPETQPEIMEAVMAEAVTSMARAHDARRETGQYDPGEVDVTEVCQRLATRLHHEYHYGPDWEDQTDGGDDA